MSFPLPEPLPSCARFLIFHKACLPPLQFLIPQRPLSIELSLHCHSSPLFHTFLLFDLPSLILSCHILAEPFRGTDVESCFSRLQDRTAVLQSQFITFAVDFSLQACLQLQVGERPQIFFPPPAVCQSVLRRTPARHFSETLSSWAF